MDTPHSPRYRPPVGIPSWQRSRWQGLLASVLAHIVVIALLVWPARFVPLELAQGGGGAGPAGGGGGGADGGGNQQAGERLLYTALAAPQTAPASDDQTEEPAVPKSAVVPPQPVLPPQPKPDVTPRVSPLASPRASAGEGAGTGLSGAGASSGSSSGAGAGPGSGGGIGSGEGTGRGSSVGPGTGGGEGKNYPPTPKQFFLPPLPAPKAVSGFTMVAWFDVDSTGQAKLLRFTPSPDRGYNRRLREILLSMKFRPAVRADGRPMRDTVDVQFSF